MDDYYLLQRIKRELREEGRREIWIMRRIDDDEKRMIKDCIRKNARALSFSLPRVRFTSVFVSLRQPPPSRYGVVRDHSDTKV